jgi:two-component system osmolarity sensor histidine kinase EnvZ
VSWSRVFHRSAVPSLFRSGAISFSLINIGLVLAVMSVAGYFVLRPVLSAAVNDFAALIVVSAQSWIELPAERRLALQMALQQQEHIRLTQANTRLNGKPSWLPYARELQHELSQRLHQPVQVQVLADNSYAVDLQLDGVALRIQFAHERIGTHPTLALALIAALTLLLAVAAAILNTLRLTQPLRAASLAAQAVGRGETPALPAQVGVRELDELFASFNHMAQQIRDLVHTRSALLSGVSHDLRSPIARLTMALELARNQPTQARFDDMARYLEQMNQLIGNFLDYARGTSVQVACRIDIHALLQRLTQDYPAQIQHATDAAPCTGDVAALERALRNFLDNAIKHASSAMQPELSAHRDDNAWHFSVRDSGTGMSDAARVQAFAPFERLDSSRQVPGSGLGLSIVKELCRSHGWQVGLDAAAGGGTLAWIRIPDTPVVTKTSIRRH